MVLHESGLQFNLINIDTESIVTNLFFNLNFSTAEGHLPSEGFFSSWCGSFLARICLQSCSENGKRNKFLIGSYFFGGLLLGNESFVINFVLCCSSGNLSPYHDYTMYICNYMGCVGRFLRCFTTSSIQYLPKTFYNDHPRCKWVYLSIHRALLCNHVTTPYAGM